jgi:hypothetical protein
VPREQLLALVLQEVHERRRTLYSRPAMRFEQECSICRAPEDVFDYVTDADKLTS